MAGKQALILVLVGIGCMVAQADEPRDVDWLQRAQAALSAGKTDDAIEAASKAIQANPQSISAREVRGWAQSYQRKYKDAIRDAEAGLRIDANAAGCYRLRGRCRFATGDIAGSVKDFDEYARLRPDRKAELWERGISLYYLDRFKEGAQQFADYQNHVASNDVENAVWRFLCVARAHDVDRARKEYLRIDRDPRVGMMEVYALFRGDGTPDEVLRVAASEPTSPSTRNRSLFYAHLYLGLYYEAHGKDQLAEEHLTLAAKKHKIGHYMWDVANVHANLIQKRKDGKKGEREKGKSNDE